MGKPLFRYIMPIINPKGEAVLISKNEIRGDSKNGWQESQKSVTDSFCYPPILGDKIGVAGVVVPRNFTKKMTADSSAVGFRFFQTVRRA